MSRVVDKIAAGGEPLSRGDAEVDGLSMCNQVGCYEWAQTGDPTCADTLKFKCPAHEAAARARGETGERVMAVPTAARMGIDNKHTRPPTGFDGWGSIAPPPKKQGRKKCVYEFNADGSRGRTWESAAAAAIELRVHRQTMGQAVRRGTTVHGRRYSYSETLPPPTVPNSPPIQEVPCEKNSDKPAPTAASASVSGGTASPTRINSAATGAGASTTSAEAARAPASAHTKPEPSPRPGPRSTETPSLPLNETPATSPAVPEPVTKKLPINKGASMAIGGGVADGEKKTRARRRVKCVDTGETWDGVQEAADAIGCSKGGLGAALSPSGPGKILGKRFAWADVDDTPSAKVRRAARVPRGFGKQPLGEQTPAITLHSPPPPLARWRDARRRDRPGGGDRRSGLDDGRAARADVVDHGRRERRGIENREMRDNTMTAKKKAELAESLVNQLRSVLLMADRRGGSIEKFEIEMLRQSIAKYDGQKKAQ